MHRQPRNLLVKLLDLHDGFKIRMHLLSLDAWCRPDGKTHAPPLSRCTFRHSIFLHIPWQCGKEMRGAQVASALTTTVWGFRIMPQEDSSARGHDFTNVTAPSDAEETSAAYLANTPRL